MTAEDYSRLMLAHRSIRSFHDRPIDPALVDRVLVEALHGSSSSGNLNMVSVIKTRDTERKRRLCELHFNLETAVERARAGCDAVGWQGATTLRGIPPRGGATRPARRSAARSGA